MSNSRVFVLTASAVIAGIALAGCSAPQTTAPDAAPPPVEASASPALYVAQAADTTRSAGSARIMSTTNIAGAQESTIRAEGVVDFAGNEAAMRVSSSLFGGSADMQVIIADGSSYIQIPVMGQKWISMPLQDLGVNFADPSQSLDMLKKVADLREVGQEPIEGVEATKYAGTVDLKDAFGQMDIPADQKKDLDKLAGTAQITVWVDDQDRIVRFDQKASLDLGTGDKVETTSSTTLSDFGVATDITPPPADEVMDGSALKGLGGLTGQPG